MLVLRRRIGERVRIAGGIMVEVLEMNGRTVSLGFEAPAEVSIWRNELAELVNEAHERAEMEAVRAQAGPGPLGDNLCPVEALYREHEDRGAGEGGSA